MIVPVYITLVNGADRPYVSSLPPGRERKESLKKQGAVVYLAEVLIPSFRMHDHKVQVLARKTEEVR